MKLCMSTECCLFLQNWAVNHVISLHLLRAFWFLSMQRIPGVYCLDANLSTSPACAPPIHKSAPATQQGWKVWPLPRESTVEACICRENLPAETCNICAVWWWNLWWSTCLQGARVENKNYWESSYKNQPQAWCKCEWKLVLTRAWPKHYPGTDLKIITTQTAHSFNPVGPHQHRGATAFPNDGSNDVRSIWNPALRTVSDIHGLLDILKWNIAGSTLGMYRLNSIFGVSIIQNKAC